MPNIPLDETFVEEEVQEVEQTPEESLLLEESWTVGSHPVDRDTDTNHLQVSADPKKGANRAQKVEYGLYSLEPSSSAQSIKSLIDQTWSHFTTTAVGYTRPTAPPPTFFLAAGDINEFDMHSQYLERGPTNSRLTNRPNTIFCVYYIKNDIAHPIPNYKTLEVLLVQEGLTYDDIKEASDADYNKYDLEMLTSGTGDDEETAKQEFNRRKLVTLDHKWTINTRYRSGYKPKAPFKRDPGDYWAPYSHGSSWDNDENKMLPDPYWEMVYKNQTWKEKLREKFEGQLITLKGRSKELNMLMYGSWHNIRDRDVIRYHNNLNEYNVEIPHGNNITDEFVDHIESAGICTNLKDDGLGSPIWNDFSHIGSVRTNIEPPRWGNNDPLEVSEYMTWWDSTVNGDMWDKVWLHPYEPAGSVKYYGNFVESVPPTSTNTGNLLDTSTLTSQLDQFLVDGDALKVTLDSMNTEGFHVAAASEVKNDLQKIWVTNSNIGADAWILKKGPYTDGTNQGYITGNEVDSDQCFWKLIAKQSDQDLINWVQNGYNKFAFDYGEDKGFGPAGIDIISQSINVMNQGAHGSVALNIPSYLFLDQANVQTDPVFQANEFYYKTYGDTIYDPAAQNLNLNDAVLYSDQYWTAGLSKYPIGVPDWGDEILLNTISPNISGDGSYNDTPFDKDVQEAINIFQQASQEINTLSAAIDTWMASVTALKNEISNSVAAQTNTSFIGQGDLDRWTIGPNNINSQTFGQKLLEEFIGLQIQSDTVQNISAAAAEVTKNRIGRVYVQRMFRLIQSIRNWMWLNSDASAPYEKYIINWPDSAKDVIYKYFPDAPDAWLLFHPDSLDIFATGTNPVVIQPDLIYTLTLPNASNNPPVVAQVYQYPPVAGYAVGQYRVHTCPFSTATNYASNVGGFPSNYPQLQQYFVYNKQDMDGNAVDAPDSVYRTDIPPYGTTIPTSGGGGTGGGNTGGGGTGGFCFVGETLVTMPDSTYKRIDEIRVGDIVKSEIGTSKVKRVNIHSGEHEIYALNDSKYFVTKEHPFKTENGWKAINPHETWEYHGVESNILSVDDVLIKNDTTEVLNTISKCDTTVDAVYSLILDNERVYYVYDYLVHNAEELGKGETPGVDPNP